MATNRAQLERLEARQGSPSLNGSPAKRRRTAFCGVCAACNRVDCGVCINCADKPKFGGRGVRKQSCLRRRCSRSSDSKGAAEPEEQAEGSAEAAGGREDAGFWLAVEGCMALLNGSVGRTSPTSSSDSPVPAGFVCAHARPHAAACAAIDLAAAAAVDPASACASLAAVAADAERIAAGDAASDVSDEMVGVAPHQGDDDADTETQPTPTLAPSRDPHVSPVMLAGSALLECSLGGFETPPRAECSQPQRGSSSSPVLASLPTNMPVLAGGKK